MAYIGKGTSLQVLTENAANILPTFQSSSSSGAITLLEGNTGGPIAPVAGIVNTVGTGSLTSAGAGNTISFSMTGLTNHALLVGGGTSTITKVGPTATAGQVLQSAGSSADPVFSTATYPSTTTINQILYSSANNVVGQITTANSGVLTTGATGVPAITALSSNGQLIIGSGSGAPAAATLTAGTGVSITNGSNSITVALNYVVVSVTGTSKTLGLTDDYTFQNCSNGATQTITYPPNGTIPFPIGARIDGAQMGVGQVVLAPGAGVTLRSKLGNLKTSAQYSGWSSVKIGTDEWEIVGDLAP